MADRELVRRRDNLRWQGVSLIDRIIVLNHHLVNPVEYPQEPDLDELRAWLSNYTEFVIEYQAAERPRLPACPRCGASEGTPCRTPAGRNALYVHRERPNRPSTSFKAPAP